MMKGFFVIRAILQGDPSNRYYNECVTPWRWTVDIDDATRFSFRQHALDALDKIETGVPVRIERVYFPSS